MKIQKFNPNAIEETTQVLGRKMFLAKINELKTLPENTAVDFYIRTNFQFADTAKANGCLFILGTQTGVWKKHIREELKKDKKQVLFGTVILQENQLYLTVNKGAAKPAIILKQAKAWLKKAAINLDFKGLMPTKEEVVEHSSDQQQGNPTPPTTETSTTQIEARQLIRDIVGLYSQLAKA